MKKIKYLIIINFLAVTNLFATNYINNGGFEDGPSGYPNFHSQFVGKNTTIGPDYWKSQYFIDANGYNNHSPDWHSSTSWPQADVHNNGGAHSGDKYVNMGDFEMIQQEVSGLTDSKPYVLCFYFQLSSHNILNQPTSLSNDSYFNVYISENRMDYKADDVHNVCSDDAKEYKSGDWTPIFGFKLDPALYPVGSGWYKMTEIIWIPRSFKNKANWIAFDLNTPYCVSSMLILDDIKLEDLCDLPCIPSTASQEILYGSVEASLHNSSWEHHSIQTHAITGNQGFLNPFTGNTITPFHIYMVNAMGFNFIVYDRWGHEQLNVFSFDPETLNDPFYNDYLLVWQGDNLSYNTLPPDLYNYSIRIWNCVEDFTVYGHFDLWSSGNAQTFIEEYLIFDKTIPSNCCRARSFFPQNVISGTSEDHSNDFTYAGGGVSAQGFTASSYCTIENGASVSWTSENEINLLLNFTSELGSNFEAKIEPCGSRNIEKNSRIRETFYETEKNNYSSNILVKPTITNGQIQIILDKDIDFQYELTNIDGKKLLLGKGKNYKEISINDFASGVYFLKLTFENKYKLIKIIKI